MPVNRIAYVDTITQEIRRGSFIVDLAHLPRDGKLILVLQYVFTVSSNSQDYLESKMEQLT